MEVAEDTRKRTRASDGGGGSLAGGPDRLSALPDCLLHVIMSSLKARQVVQTCVLSTRWRHLWRSVPCLDIDIVEFRTKAVAHASTSGGIDSTDSDSDSESESANNQDKGEGWDEFEDFAVNLMLRCNIALLDSFRLDIDRGWEPVLFYASSSTEAQSWGYSGRQAVAWLRRAMKYCTSGSGRAVSQRGQGLNNNLSPISWRLRRLHLCHVPLDDHFVEHLSSVCRSLEDLELDHCTCKIRAIVSDSLKNLVLKRCTWDGFLSEIVCPVLKTLVIDGGSNMQRCNRLAVAAAMVTYLCLDVDGVGFRGGILIDMMLSLDRALIHIRRHKQSFISKSMCGSKLGGDQIHLLWSVSKATSLELIGLGTTVLGEEPKFLDFQNLRNLVLGHCDLSDNFRTLRFFVQGSPNLEKVTLRYCKFPHDSDDKEETCNLDKTSSSSSCYCDLDFLREKNVKLEIKHKHGHVCQPADDLVRDLPNLKATTDAIPDAAASAAANDDASEDSMPRSAEVGPRRGTRHRTTSLRISGPEWERTIM